jgi:glycosyltransferase involved in cell wall biosynthesis
MLASLKLYKGIEEFVEIARSLEPHKKISFTLVVNASEQECESYFKGKDVSKNIEIYSSQSEVAPFYSKARLVVNLSHTDTWIETFGLTIIEAMAYGIPVIAPPVGGPSEIVTDGLNGYLLDSKKVECIAEKIVELASDQVTWARLSKNALLRSEMFSQESFQKEIINLLND